MRDVPYVCESDIPSRCESGSRYEVSECMSGGSGGHGIYIPCSKYNHEND